jgi:hypothetical protein
MTVPTPDVRIWLGSLGSTTIRPQLVHLAVANISSAPRGIPGIPTTARLSRSMPGTVFGRLPP